AEAAGAGVTLRIDGPIDDAPIEADLDPVRVREIVANLTRNAVRATSGGGCVSVRVRPSDRSDEAGVEIEVRDDGRGIPAADLERVFDRFHSGPESDGTGLGLTITRNLVLAHGGDIALDSTEGEGTTVVVFLPLHAG
ncbi:MAG: ATP-binding protein, partial [Acidimicrobiia bacterium]|nr:ATP-binding protein [Acidimicrobiia bacterium]